MEAVIAQAPASPSASLLQRAGRAGTRWTRWNALDASGIFSAANGFLRSHQAQTVSKKDAGCSWAVLRRQWSWRGKDLRVVGHRGGVRGHLDRGVQAGWLARTARREAREATDAALKATDNLSSADRSDIVRVLVAAARTRTDTLGILGSAAGEQVVHGFAAPRSPPSRLLLQEGFLLFNSEACMSATDGINVRISEKSGKD